jgi:hypothetical protein
VAFRELLAENRDMLYPTCRAISSMGKSVVSSSSVARSRR